MTKRDIEYNLLNILENSEEKRKKAEAERDVSTTSCVIIILYYYRGSIYREAMSVGQKTLNLIR
jgi:hypothetical protein